MNLSIDELETIKKKSFQEGYDEGHKIGFEKGYEQGMDYSDSCLEDRIEELEEELSNIIEKLESVQKGGAECMDEDAKQASIPCTYNAPQHDWKCGYPDITKGKGGAE